MCGRYRLSRRKKMIEDYFETANEVDWEPRYNVAPSQSVGIIRQDPVKPERYFSRARWGLVPFWTLLANSPSMSICRLGLLEPRFVPDTHRRGPCVGHDSEPRVWHQNPVYEPGGAH
jgi:putative SOS response-associated peptidase YedK